MRRESKQRVHKKRGDVMKGLKKRIEKLEDEVLPQRFEEIRIINHIPGGLLGKYGREFTIRVPVKKRKR